MSQKAAIPVLLRILSQHLEPPLLLTVCQLLFYPRPCCVCCSELDTRQRVLIIFLPHFDSLRYYPELTGTWKSTPKLKIHGKGIHLSDSDANVSRHRRISHPAAHPVCAGGQAYECDQRLAVCSLIPRPSALGLGHGRRNTAPSSCRHGGYPARPGLFSPSRLGVMLWWLSSEYRQGVGPGVGRSVADRGYF